MSVQKVNINDKLSQFTAHWSPKIVGELNGQHVKLVKFAGEFVWHKHDNEDEMFLVVNGAFEMHLRDEIVELTQGDFIIIPKGTEHKPVAAEEVHVMLFEPASTLNTGDKVSELTVETPEYL
ncbi:cupin domain-containing protein [Mucilaginibacter sp. ZT4R22]|uniref:Cupin domain-containing protein n=1 Tax=Mucilaginibacter pankratovii TaxID=2772110 RepID=A0ABR7WRQ6_9SPHI|nr:cupin domain-containing protein [Mucilaginibacter pankratovii]MBD1364207.1 cupin domain-containing protein [Mucilaginibacter pankratovii]